MKYPSALKVKGGWQAPKSNGVLSRCLFCSVEKLPMFRGQVLSTLISPGIYRNRGSGHHPKQGKRKPCLKNNNTISKVSLQEHGLILFHLGSVWVEGAKLGMSRTRNMLPVGTEVVSFGLCTN